MFGPTESVRYPAVAGRFYPAQPQQCRAEALSFLKPHQEASQKSWMGAVIPHAGWICSGAVAGQAIATLSSAKTLDVVIVFGAVHTPLPVNYAALDSHQLWRLPAGDSQVDQALQRELASLGGLFRVDERLHASEHAIEVNIPLIQLAFPQARILPIEVPPIPAADAIGRQVAQAVAKTGLRVAYLASSDFTHYGPSYGFTPAGIGPPAMEWAKENDRRLLKLISDLAGDRIVPEAQQRHNACGAGAIAAMLGACREAGATGVQILWHTNSYETLARVQPQPATHAVGYAAIVVG